MICSVRKAMAAGVMICMGCIVFLKVGGVAGAVLFSAGLWFVVNFDAELFTGRVTRKDYSPAQKGIMLLMNIGGAFACGLLASLCLPEITQTARTMMDGLAAQSPLALLWKAAMCGVCMYLATTKVGDGSRLPFVIYGVALFILSGYGHSIAIAGYAAIAGRVAWWVLPVAAAGNAAGSYAIKWLLKK